MTAEIEDLIADLRATAERLRAQRDGVLTLAPATVLALLDHIGALQRRVDGLLPAPLPGFE